MMPDRDQHTPTNEEREELADLIEGVGRYIPGSHGHDYINPNKAADAVLAAGYRKPGPITDAEVEAAARAMYRAAGYARPWSVASAETRSRYWVRARIALRGVEAARAADTTHEEGNTP